MEIAPAVARYDALLRGDPALARESGEQLLGRQPAAKLLFGSRLMCGCLRPNLLSAELYERVQRTCAILAGAAKRLESAMLADPALLDLLELTPEERRLVAIEPGYADSAAATRLDSFMDGDRWQFVEYNAESPAGIAYTDTLSALFRELPIMRAFEREYRLRPLPARQAVLEALLRAFREWGGKEASPLVAIVDWGGLPTAGEFELFQDFFAEQGIRAIIVEPQALEFRGGRLYAGDQHVELVYRRVLLHELLARLDEAPALVRAYEAGAACVVNGFRCKLFHKKAIFSVLSDDRHAHLFTAPEQAAIRAHIPWTRTVRDGYSSYGGERIELVRFILDHRERLVLKPNDDYGGHGVVLGWESDEATWRETLATALGASYVVQERVGVPRAEYPVFEEGALRFAELACDMDPFVFGTQATGMLTRLSPAALLNVTAGSASTVPTFIVEGAR